MEAKQRKVGRPKAPPRTGPLVLGEDYARTKVSLEVSERAAEELAEYTRWVEKWSGIAANEAKFKTVDFALREIFRRDRIWQAERRGPSRPANGAPAGTAPEASAPVTVLTPSAAAPPASAPRPAATTSPSLPPPTPGSRERSGGGQS
jgi:hypothetical protein